MHTKVYTALLVATLSCAAHESHATTSAIPKTTRFQNLAAKTQRQPKAYCARLISTIVRGIQYLVYLVAYTLGYIHGYLNGLCTQSPKQPDAKLPHKAP